jgi:phosphinothricin acetyltransferase
MIIFAILCLFLFLTGDAQANDLPAITDRYAHHVLHGTGTFEIEPPTLRHITFFHQPVEGSNKN